MRTGARRDSRLPLPGKSRTRGFRLRRRTGPDVGKIFSQQSLRSLDSSFLSSLPMPTVERREKSSLRKAVLKDECETLI